MIDSQNGSVITEMDETGNMNTMTFELFCEFRKIYIWVGNVESCYAYDIEFNSKEFWIGYKR